MQNLDLEKKALDQQFTRRFGQRLSPALVMVLPLLIFAGTTYIETGVVSLLAVAFASSTFVVLLAWVLARARTQSLQSMRDEGLASEAYSPPMF